MARRSGQIETIVANEVCENDTFEYEFGFNEKLIHKPMIKGDRGKAYAYYAYAVLKDGGKAFVVMSRNDVDRIRTQYSKAKYGSPWETEYDAMAKKTVIKQLMKYLPISVELLEKANADDNKKVEVKINSDSDIAFDEIDVTPEYSAQQEEYGEGGEIIENKKEEVKTEETAEIKNIFEQK